jgi:CheY-like chemotaxis protein
LVVDDDLQVRVLLNALLRNDLGHEVVFAPHGEAALEAYRNAKPDVVITDLVMPYIHGIQLIQLLKSKTPDCKIIAMSGKAPEQLEWAEAVGALATLTKPIQREELVQAVEKALGQGRSSPESQGERQAP